jgi:hypothetical protein
MQTHAKSRTVSMRQSGRMLLDPLWFRMADALFGDALGTFPATKFWWKPVQNTPAWSHT